MSNARDLGTRKRWRKLVKKIRRKRIRQNLAALRKEKERIRENSPTYLKEIAKKKLVEEFELEQYEFERKERHEKWIKDEEEAQRIWHEHELVKNLAEEKKLKELQRIRSEWEAEQKKLKEQAEKLEMIKLEEESRKQGILRRINDFILNGGEVPEELKTNWETNPGKELCSFFNKVGACRFGLQCSRNHQYPGISRVLLFLNFYSHFTLGQNNFSEYDTDIGLEFEDNDMYLHFKEFYQDVAPELKKFGDVKMIKVCCNTEFHLRGNVYVEYGTLRDALIAYQKFHGRWYGSKQLNVEFVNITDWGRAVCGDFVRKRCPKGKSCNFLHVFKNPKNEYPVEWNRSRIAGSTSVIELNCDFDSPDKTVSCRWSESPKRGSPERKKDKVKEGDYNYKLKKRHINMGRSDKSSKKCREAGIKKYDLKNKTRK